MKNINIKEISSLLTILLAREIYDIINRFDSGKNAKHQSGGGRPKKSLSDWSITKMACPKEN